MQQLWESGHHMYLLCLPLWPSRSCSSAEGICAITYNIVIGTLLECINLDICAQPNTSEPLNISTSFNISNHLELFGRDQSKKPPCMREYIFWNSGLLGYRTDGWWSSANQNIFQMIPSILSICTFSSEAPGKIHRQEVIHVIEVLPNVCTGPREVTVDEQLSPPLPVVHHGPHQWIQFLLMQESTMLQCLSPHFHIVDGWRH